MTDKYSEPDVNEVDFTDVGYEGLTAREYAKEVAAEVADEKDFDRVRGSDTYIETTGVFLQQHNLGVEASGAKFRYNRELVSEAEVKNAAESALKSNIRDEDVVELLEDQ